MAQWAPRTTRRLMIAGAILLLLTVAFSVPWKLNFLRDTIVQRVEAATGRAFAIEGDIWWWWKGRLVAERMRFANPAWAGRDQMLSVEKVDANIRMLSLLKRRLVLPEVYVLKPDLWLETDAEGRFNGNLDREQRDSESAVELGEVVLDQGRLRFVQKHTQSDVQVLFESTAAAGNEAGRLNMSASGRWHGLELAAKGTGDAVLRLREATKPYAFDVAASIGATKVKVAGNITGLAKPTAADLRVQGEGPSLAEWYRIANLGLPNTPAYRTAGRLRLDGKAWHYEDFTSRVGNSDLAGRVRFEPRSARPFISGTLVSQRLDLEDFAPVVGKTTPTAAATPPPKASAPKPKTPKATAAPSSKLMPTFSFSSEKWDTLDADIQFEGRSIQNVGKHPFERLKMRVVMDNRRLTLDPLQFGFAGGDLNGKFSIDGRSEPMAARLEVRAQRLKLDDLVPQLNNTRIALGTVNGRAVLAARGNSFAQMLASADGEAQMAMGKGQISNLLIEIVDLDAQEALGFLIRGDKPVDVRCALVDVGFKRGVMDTRTIVFDTADTIIEATGQVDFVNEQLNLRVKPVPKDFSLLTLRVPFDVKGTFQDPSVTPDRARLFARGAGAILLGTIAPAAALLALIETGPGKDSDCEALIARAKSEGVPVKNAPGASTPAPVRPASGATPAPIKQTDQNKK